MRIKRNYKKILLLFFIFFILIFLFSGSVGAADDDYDKESYNEQMKSSNADKLLNELTPEARKSLEEIGITSPDYEALSALSLDKIFAKVISLVSTESKAPVMSLSIVIGIILLCALAESFKTSLSDGPLSGVLGSVSTICIASALIIPVVMTISRATAVIEGASSFILAYVPVMAVLMISGGQAVSGGSYYTLMMGAAQAVAQLSSKFLMPLLSILLGISITSAIAPRINLISFAELFSKTVKWVLAFVMSLFVTLLTLQNVLGTAADNAAARAARFTISSAVPVVGSALSDAFTTVQSCVRLLKSGVGVFAIIAAIITFLPVIIECIVWMVSINLSATAAEIFGLKEPCALLRASGKVIGTTFAVLMSVMTVFIISTSIVLVIGGGAV